MDLGSLRYLKLDSASNATVTSLPSTLLDALIPGYGIISQLIFRFAGVDIGHVVSGCLVVFGLFHGMQFLYDRAYVYFSSYFTASVYIEDDDALYRQVMIWIAEQRMTKESRDLKAVTKWVGSDEDSDDESLADDDDVLDDKGIFNFEKWASNIPPRYEPNYGTDRFHYNGRLFMFAREKRENKRNMWANGEIEYLTIRCVGRSTQPIKELLNYIKSWTLTKENKMTSVYRPSPKEGYGDRTWDRQSTRPSRPMRTVSLDQQQKADIVMDINEYLHPATARWYAARGIPYRRGYLFHGPPGTGKTSLSFALAGIFGLDVYCVSLNEVGLTESELNRLFSALPRRCIVLLEDIDSAGLRRDDLDPVPTATAPTGSDSPVVDSSSASEDGLTKITKAADALLKDPAKLAATAGGTKSLISLSGLLNIIDGAASHEGRVLIMTTNCPEALDPALIRPGRIDLQVRFTLASPEQTADIFTRMYSSAFDEKKMPSSDNNNNTTTTPAKSTSTTTTSTSRTSSLNQDQGDDFLTLLSHARTPELLAPEQLATMAAQFAAEIPEATFSPAEIQGFLLMRKREPRRALEEVGAWRDTVMERRRGKGAGVVGAGAGVGVSVAV